jgi:hypothetical protein
MHIFIFEQGRKCLTPAVTGGSLCLGLYLHQFLAGLKIGLPYVFKPRLLLYAV